MKIDFPSPDFDAAVAAAAHGEITDAQARALNELLLGSAAARDEYILRLELHSRLASERDLFASPEGVDLVFPAACGANSAPSDLPATRTTPIQNKFAWTLALAACLTLIGFGFWSLQPKPAVEEAQPTSKAVAMLNRAVDARWARGEAVPRLNGPLEPGWLRLEAGLAQVIFYSGARFVIEGPAELELVSRTEANIKRGKIVAEIPAQARGFRLRTPHADVHEPGASIGLNVDAEQTGLHAFKGSVKAQSSGETSARGVPEGAGALLGAGRSFTRILADAPAFASLFDLQARSAAADAHRYDQWRMACRRLEADPSLIIHFNFEDGGPSAWQIHNLGNPRAGVSDATIVGSQWVEGRWPEKRALEFQSVNDRVRLSAPGEFNSLTLAAWVCVKGLDRAINSIFMSDGFEPGTIHWLIRRDGVLGLTVIGADPRQHQIVASSPEITLDKFGMWLHLAVSLDAGAGRVTHYVNGAPASETTLKIAPPFRIGAAELGNWNPKGFPENDPFMIRNFSGAMDEFCLFGRALDAEEIRALHAQGRPQGDTASVL